jgi:quercetin dioxygenase-like cupin family protein
MDENEFRLKAKNEGYSEPEVDEVEFAAAKEMHRHDHSVLSLVLSGEFTMLYENGTDKYGPGDWCGNPGGTLHTERIGIDGVVALVAKK